MLSVPRKRREGIDEVDAEMDIDAKGEAAAAKKRRMPTGEDIGPKLVDMIKKLDDQLHGASVESAIESLANILEDNLDPYEGQIIHILYECAAYLPEKITIFSTLVGLLNVRSADFGERLLLRFVDEFQHTFTSGEYDISIRLATFLCDLCNAHVVEANSIVSFLYGLVDMATDENMKSNFFVYLVLHTLPWVGAELYDKLPTKLNNLMERIALYMGRRAKPHFEILQIWSAHDFPKQEDYLDSLWSQVQNLRQHSWMEEHILRTYAPFSDVLSSSVAHQLPEFDHEILLSSNNHPLPRIVFRIFSKKDCMESDVTLPAPNAIERFLVEEDLNWIIDNNYLDWKLCAHSLLHYHRKHTVPLNYLIIETVFNQLFRLPAAPHHELFYGTMLIELCRSEANTMPQVLAMAAELLYQVTDTMQPICLDRFVDWFSYHLSNFEYRWSWADWIECVELDSLHPRRIFVREVIEKCLRLSYHKKLVEFLPSELTPIIPDEPSIIYILDDTQHPAYAKAEQFRGLILNKAGDEEILAVLRLGNNDQQQQQPTDTAGTGDEMTGSEYSIDAVAIFYSVLMKLSSKTMTHTFAALTRYHKTLSMMTANNEEVQSTILRTLYDQWILHKQMLTVTVDKMMKMRILDPSIVVAWVFSDEMKVEFKRSWVWETLSIAVTYLDKRCTAEVLTCASRRDFLEKLEQRKRNAHAAADPKERQATMAAATTTTTTTTTTIDAAETGTNDDVVVGLMSNEASQESSKMPPAAPMLGNANAAGQDNGGGGGEIGEGEEAMELDAAARMMGGNGMAGADGDDSVGMGLNERIVVQEESLRCAKVELERCEDALRNVLLNICHKFTLILTEHLLNCETDGTNIETNFYNYVIGRFKYVFLRVGQCGNQLGMAYWERMCLEHGIEPDGGQLLEEEQRGMDCKEIFFNENSGQKWVPRALLIDLEPRVLGDICNHEANVYSDLFDMDNIYQGPTGGGAGNNWARGFSPGGSIINDIMELVESETERADHLEGFAMCHSILGGTGSGLGSRLLVEIKDRYPKNVIQTYSTVQPINCNVVSAPYNIMLSLESIIEYADTCVLFDNDAFDNHCKEMNPLQKLRRDGTNENLANATEKKNYDKINSMMSQVMTSLSAPIRFYSPIYTRLMQISAFLNPFPPMLFLQPAITPFVPTREEGVKQRLIRFPRPKDVISHLSDPRRLISSNQTLLKQATPTTDRQNISNTIAANSINPNNSSGGYLLSGLIIVQSEAQGDALGLPGSMGAFPGIGIADCYSQMRSRNQSRVKDNVYRSPPWLPSTMHLTNCRLSPYMKHDQHPVTGLLLANHTQVSVTLKSMANQFDKMWRHKAMIHQYVSAFDTGGNNECEKKMMASKECVDKLLTLYRDACTDNFLPSSLDELIPKEKSAQ